MSIESIENRTSVRNTPLNSGEKWLRYASVNMLDIMKYANKKGANNEAEIEELEYAMDGQGDLMLALERAELWMQHHYDKS